MSAIIVIPARYGSTRFPGKPLVSIAGRCMLERAWRIAKAVPRVDSVLIATDDERVFSQARAWGAAVVMTDGECQNGSERVFQAVSGLSQRFDIIINFQGDSPLTPPWVLEALVNEMERDKAVRVATPAVLLSSKQYQQAAGGAGRAGTYVTFDLKHDALYFSKALIPHCREAVGDMCHAYRHIGIYCFRHEALQAYRELAPTPLEKIEKLEQLRLLEHSIPIRVVAVDLRGRTYWSVDTESDAHMVEEIIRKEGELL